MKEVLTPLLEEEDTLISGMARGADTLAAKFAASICHVSKFPADWDTHGRAAGLIRNQQMLDEGQPDIVIAFPGGRGTEHMKKIARKAGVKVVEIE